MKYEELGVKFLDTAPIYGHGADAFSGLSPANSAARSR